jgi:hypothetical protein
MRDGKRRSEILPAHTTTLFVRFCPDIPDRVTTVVMFILGSGRLEEVRGTVSHAVSHGCEKAQRKALRPLEEGVGRIALDRPFREADKVVVVENYWAS